MITFILVLAFSGQEGLGRTWFMQPPSPPSSVEVGVAEMREDQAKVRELERLPFPSPTAPAEWVSFQEVVVWGAEKERERLQSILRGGMSSTQKREPCHSKKPKEVTVIVVEKKEFPTAFLLLAAFFLSSIGLAIKLSRKKTQTTIVDPLPPLSSIQTIPLHIKQTPPTTTTP